MDEYYKDQYSTPEDAAAEGSASDPNASAAPGGDMAENSGTPQGDGAFDYSSYAGGYGPPPSADGLAEGNAASTSSEPAEGSSYNTYSSGQSTYDGELNPPPLPEDSFTDDDPAYDGQSSSPALQPPQDDSPES